MAFSFLEDMMPKGEYAWVKKRYGSQNANQKNRSSKVDVLGRGSSGDSKDALGRVTTGGSQKPNIYHVLGK